MDVREAKKELRKKVREAAKALTPEYQKEASAEICRRVIGTDAYQNADTVFCFVGVGTEPDTRAIIEDGIRQGKRVCVPLCIDDHTMEAVEIRDYDKDLEKGWYGLLEPKKDLPRVEIADLDFGVIPCVTCDAAGNRLGHGKGYYDRYLENTDFAKVMVCFAKIMVPEGEVPVGPYDLPIETVITDA